MPPKGKKRGPKNKKAVKKDGETSGSREHLQAYLAYLKEEFEAHLASLEADHQKLLDEIKTSHEKAIKNIPEKYRGYTIGELRAMQQELGDTFQTDIDTSILKVTSSVDYVVSQLPKEADYLKPTSSKKQSAQKTANDKKKKPGAKGSSVSENKSQESAFTTPDAKPPKPSAMTVTPKFDPKFPPLQSVLRKPRQGEVIMSLDGSPLQNFSAGKTKKPQLVLTDIKGRTVSITDETRPEEINSPTLKNTLKEMQRKLSTLISQR